MHEEHPELLRDQYWECVVPKDLPYTVASEHYRKDEPKGSAENYKVKKEDAMYANIMPGGGKRIISDDVYADYVNYALQLFINIRWKINFLLYFMFKIGKCWHTNGGTT